MSTSEVLSLSARCALPISTSIIFAPLQIVVDSADQPWVLYDAGPRNVRSPLVCFSPVCGTADVFYRQLLDLSAEGYRIISVCADQFNVHTIGTH